MAKSFERWPVEQVPAERASCESPQKRARALTQELHSGFFVFCFIPGVTAAGARSDVLFAGGDEFDEQPGPLAAEFLARSLDSFPHQAGTAEEQVVELLDLETFLAREAGPAHADGIQADQHVH